MSDENIYGLSDEVLERIEKEIAHAEIDSNTGEEFLNNAFPQLSPEVKAKIAIFSDKYVELFLDEDGEDEEEA